METQFEVALQNDLISPAVEEIHGLWKQLGKPYPPDGPDTSVHGTVPAWLEPHELEGLSEEAASFEASRYNLALEQLLELTGIWNAGGNTWHTKWERGADQWVEYVGKSWDIVLNYISNELWDRFCESMG